jgi:membrane fusion protein, copper/silver efflux system
MMVMKNISSDNALRNSTYTMLILCRIFPISRNSSKSGPVRSVLYSAMFLLIAIVVASCKSKTSTVAKDPDVYYTCSMDPQVIESKPGKCPICHMQLTAARKSAQKNDNELQLSPQQIQLGNIIVDTIHNGVIGNQIILAGVLNFNQLNAIAVSARIAGRVDKLYFKNVGDYVPKGAKLFDLYSEELNTAKQEYILALQKQKVLGNSVIDYTALIQSAKNKLILWGMSEAQIKGLDENNESNNITNFYSTSGGYITELNIKEGDYVAEGTSIVRLADLSTLWVEAQLYTSQLPQLNSSAKAIVQFPDMPGKEIEGTIEFVNPEINPATRINLIRITIPNKENVLKPGMPVYVTIKNPQYKTLSLPVDAVLQTGKMATVWVKTSANRFMSKMIETGMESDGMIEIKSGLKEGDAVVVNGAYLLQSEYIFRKGANPMAGHDMSKMKM